jgi:hypothetical protein
MQENALSSTRIRNNCIGTAVSVPGPTIYMEQVLHESENNSAKLEIYFDT